STGGKNDTSSPYRDDFLQSHRHVLSPLEELLRQRALRERVPRIPRDLLQELDMALVEADLASPPALVEHLVDEGLRRRGGVVPPGGRGEVPDEVDEVARAAARAVSEPAMP